MEDEKVEKEKDTMLGVNLHKITSDKLNAKFEKTDFYDGGDFGLKDHDYMSAEPGNEKYREHIANPEFYLKIKTPVSIESFRPFYSVS